MTNRPYTPARHRKWPALTVTLLLLAICAASARYTASLELHFLKLDLPAIELAIAHGHAVLTINEALSSRIPRPPLRGDLRDTHKHVIKFGFDVQSPSHLTSIYTIPLWLPLNIFSIITARSWRAARSLPGHCKRCHYDLAGIPTDVCPECGKPIPDAPK